MRLSLDRAASSHSSEMEESQTEFTYNQLKQQLDNTTANVQHLLQRTALTPVETQVVSTHFRLSSLRAIDISLTESDVESIDPITSVASTSEDESPQSPLSFEEDIQAVHLSSARIAHWLQTQLPPENRVIFAIKEERENKETCMFATYYKV